MVTTSFPLSTRTTLIAPPTAYQSISHLSLITNDNTAWLQKDWGLISGTSRTTMTFSYWHKPQGEGSADIISLTWFGITDSIQHGNSGEPHLILNNGIDGDVTSPVLLTPNAWNNIVWWIDTTNATAGSRARLWLNSNEVALTFTQPITANYLTQWGNSGQRDIDMWAALNANDLSDELCKIDGQLVPPSSFFYSTPAPSNQIGPTDLSGLTFGNTGYWLRFETGVSATAGVDSSPNANSFITVDGVSGFSFSSDTP